MAKYETRAELMTRLEDAKAAEAAIIHKAEATISSMHNAIKDLHDKDSQASVKTSAYKDLLAQLCETKSLDGLNETQVNSKLIKRMMLLKYYFDK